MNRFGRGVRGIAGERLYAHFFNNGHNGLKDVLVKIIDKTNVNVNDPKTREGFWAYKLDSYWVCDKSLSSKTVFHVLTTFSNPCCSQKYPSGHIWHSLTSFLPVKELNVPLGQGFGNAFYKRRL